MKNIDLKAIAVIGELSRTRSVSLAAEHLGLGQSAISMSLSKLRRHFGDPLFVRTSSGMEPTPYGTKLIEILKDAENILQRALDHHAAFDPVTSDRTFHICSTDVAQVTLLPALAKRIQKAGSGIGVELRGITDQTPGQLESGEIDLAIGFIPLLGAGFYSQRLFQDHFVIGARSGHPRIEKKLSIEQFQSETHIAVGISGSGHSIIEKTIQEKKICRRVGIRVGGFIGLGPLIANTDMLAIMPAQIARFFASFGHIRIFDLPFHVPAYHITQQWHERFTHDPGNKWLRTTMADLFLESEMRRRA
jgi:DNA-binding transcriptional LysR family regulator